MLIKSTADEIQSYLADASYLRGGNAASVVFPESANQVAELLARSNSERTPVTVSGAGTGTVGGRVPFGGVVLATDRLNRIKSITHSAEGGYAIAEPGVTLRDLQTAVDREGLLYPPDPTERGCFLGGTIATNASGSRTFKYGPTRAYVKGLQIVLASGEILKLKRGELIASNGEVRIPLSSGHIIEAQLPTYEMPHVRKHASGYFVKRGMDVLDLFIGSEGTLGVVTEIEVSLLPKPEGLLSGVVFFESDEALLAFVREARARSLASRQSDSPSAGIDARAIEYFDKGSLNFLRQKYDTIPAPAAAAIFFEQETTSATEDFLMGEWLFLIEKNQALTDQSWFATNEQDQAKLREFRHALPVLMNEWFARHNQRKVSTDMSVPDETFGEMLGFYKETLEGSDLVFTIFGHIGDNHVHVNILPRTDDEGNRAREIYLQFLKKVASVGGTLSAEHGIGKLKREYLPLFYSEEHLREMAALKRSFDPHGILGRGNIFSEDYL
ncbi:MAG TPA: FAD-binding oxidoreductase [Pyrinomonadaceae bacterium]|nr:FAD-binding oxidoreductase [Pyrinomonadaceae bacterium]